MKRFDVVGEERVVYVIVFDNKFMSASSLPDISCQPFWTANILQAQHFTNLEAAEKAAMPLVSKQMKTGVEVVKVSLNIEYEVKTCL